MEEETRSLKPRNKCQPVQVNPSLEGPTCNRVVKGKGALCLPTEAERERVRMTATLSRKEECLKSMSIS